MIDVPRPPRWTEARFNKVIAALVNPRNEHHFQTAVHDLLDGYGWTRLHIPPVKAGSRWVTPGRKGFPDVCALHPEGVCLVLELKMSAAKFDSPDQRHWMALWQRVARRAPDVVSAFVARPSDAEALLSWLVPPSLAGHTRPNPPLPLDAAGKLGL